MNIIYNKEWQEHITLYELVMRQKVTNESDADLIAEWFAKNNMAVEGIEIISKLAKKKIENDEWKYGWLASDLLMYNAGESLINEYGIKDGCKLDEIIRSYIISYRLGEKFEEKYPQHIEWLKKFIPKHKLPFIFWQQFREYLHTQNIYFKDEKEENKK